MQVIERKDLASDVDDILFDFLYPEEAEWYKHAGENSELVQYLAVAAAAKYLQDALDDFDTAKLNEAYAGLKSKSLIAPWGAVRLSVNSPRGKWILPPEMAALEQQIKDFKAKGESKDKYFVHGTKSASHKDFKVSAEFN